jgi:hypothetical protein
MEGADDHLVGANAVGLPSEKGAISSPMSSGSIMRARLSGVSGTGRWRMIGVATSPGQITVERMPFAHSSRLRL